MNFRWDRWLEGLVASGLLSVVMIVGPLAEGGFTKAEAYMLLSAFLGGIALYCKNHLSVSNDPNDK